MGYKEEKQRQLDRRYLRMARIWAENSYCVRRKVGALIVKDKMIISDGYNGTPSGFENICEDETGKTKSYVLHAEANAITKVAKSANNCDGSTLYITAAPCIECSKLDHSGRHPARGLLRRIPFGGGARPAAQGGNRVRADRRHRSLTPANRRMKRIVIMGATSGIGLETAKRCIAAGWRVGAAGRRSEELERLRGLAPQQVETEAIDVTDDVAPAALERLIERLDGMDVYLHVAGVGSQNPQLDPTVELHTVRTNVEGFTRMTTAAYGYFAAHGGGRIAVVSSIAGTRGLGVAAAYSASKRFQNTYIDSLAQLARMQGSKIRFTDIRPGFVATALLRNADYPMLMRPEKVAEKLFRALERGKRRVVIDRRYALLVRLWRLIPQGVWERLPIRSRD